MTLGLWFGLVGHILCGVCDGLLTYGKNGKLDFKNIKDAEKMSVMFENMPLHYPLASIVLGTYAITMFAPAYFGLSQWIEQYSPIAATIMFVSAIVYLIPITAHHIICGFVEWFYIRLDRKNEVRNAVLDFQKKTVSTMIVGYLGVAVFVITLFVMVASGQTPLPRWACVFNTLPLILILTPTGLPAKGNIAGAIMFAGLLFFIH